MTCRTNCICCSDKPQVATLQSRNPPTGSLSLAHKFVGLGRAADRDELEITRLDLLPPNFVESHFGNLIKTSRSGSGCNRDNASVKRSMRTHEPINDPTLLIRSDVEKGSNKI